ncbi:MAG TPA: glycosyltransferase family 2 protein [Candidatus Saccharimonadales bacterium]|nr:glycosyltransferase family 2 protein [Candidatus Saccharimonadales bacterium]
MDLSIIIVSWNVKEKLRSNLKALYQSEGNFKSEIFVVDNNSQDNSARMVREEFPQVKLISNSENLGFSKANNQALRLASGRFILLLNPDMRVFKNSLVQILTWAKDNQQATVIGCRLINDKEEIVKQIRKFPRFFDQLLVVLKLPHIFPGLLNKYLCSRFDYSRDSRVDSIRGAFFLINKENYQKISGCYPYLDERYFIWFEEVDFCRQVYQLGGEVWYTPAAKCLDYVGQSFKQVTRLKTQVYFRDSMLKYFKKWKPLWQSKTLALVWKLVAVFVK